MLLIRDVLDSQLYDREHLKVGKVDGVIITLRRGRPPRIMALELGMSTLWSRVHPRLGDWIAMLERRFRLADVRPMRIRFERITKSGVDVVVDVDAKRTRAFAFENWLSRTVISRIPGSHHGRA